MYPRIVIEFPPIDVDRASDLFDRGLDSLRRLWANERFVAAMNADPAVSEVFAIYEETVAESQRQISEARAAGRRHVTIHLSLPASKIRSLMAFARAMLGFVSDETSMEIVGARPISRSDAAFVEPFMMYAEQAIDGLGV